MQREPGVLQTHIACFMGLQEGAEALSLLNESLDSALNMAVC
jgi:hypothetical protein